MLHFLELRCLILLDPLLTEAHQERIDEVMAPRCLLPRLRISLYPQLVRGVDEAMAPWYLLRRLRVLLHPLPEMEY